MALVTLTKEEYVNEEDWHAFFASGKTFDNIPYDPEWTVMMAVLKKNKKFKETERKIRDQLILNKSLKIYPRPNYVFKALSITAPDDVSVVFLGQDPYFNCEYYQEKPVPQAMGLSFSVPNNMRIPSSLDNIFSNMLKFGQITKKPTSGNLWFWASQGCLMLNTALTVEDGQKKSHSNYWEWFTDYMIKYISDNLNGVVFVLWGSDAYSKINHIDLDKHHTICSSHPSGLSANKPFRNFPAFMDFDHFGEINKLLKSMGKREIMWD